MEYQQKLWWVQIAIKHFLIFTARSIYTLYKYLLYYYTIYLFIYLFYYLYVVIIHDNKIARSVSLVAHLGHAPCPEKSVSSLSTIGKNRKTWFDPLCESISDQKECALSWNPKYATEYHQDPIQLDYNIKIY